MCHVLCKRLDISAWKSLEIRQDMSRLLAGEQNQAAQLRSFAASQHALIQVDGLMAEATHITHIDPSSVTVGASQKCCSPAPRARQWICQGPRERCHPPEGCHGHLSSPVMVGLWHWLAHIRSVSSWWCSQILGGGFHSVMGVPPIILILMVDQC